MRKKCKYLPYEIRQRHSVSLKTDVWMLGFALFQSITKINLNKRYSVADKSSLEFHTYLSKVWNKLE